MTDDERFAPIDRWLGSLSGMHVEVTSSRRYIEIYESNDLNPIMLSVKDARELRDYLDQVLP